jgi:hypothetical protein
MNVQPGLFATMPPQPPQPDPLAIREAAMKAAYDAADERFREEYRAFVLRYLGKHVDGTAEEIRLAYERSGLPGPRCKRASGQIFRELRRDGAIVECGKRRSKLYGNDLATYRRAE